MTLVIQQFPPAEIAAKFAASLGIGLLVGIEREWSNKDLGARTFALTALLGTLAVLSQPSVATASLVGILLVIAFANGRAVLVDRSLEATTSVALLVTFVLGELVGEGHLFTPVAAAILMTMLLTWKGELRRFAGGLQPGEIRSAVLLGLLGLVIYPILPNRFVDPWQLLNPRQAWLTVIVIAGIGFLNYVLLKLYGARGLYLSSFLGGSVNSSAAAVEIAKSLHSGQVPAGVAVAVLLLTIVAMFVRNLVILGLFAPTALASALAPMSVMILFALVFIHLSRRAVASPLSEIRLESPVSLRRVLTFAFLFLLIQVISTLSQRHLGEPGFLGVSVLGGLVSSASTTAASANLVGREQVGADVAGMGVILASIASALVNLPVVYRSARQTGVFLRLSIFTTAIIIVGMLTAFLQHHFWPLE
jgi:uncharacterized membrane protein (DUF4010 family)